MTAVLDLNQRQFSREVGPLTVIGTWVRTDDGVVSCLVLIRTGEERNEHTVPCVVTLDSAFKFDRSSHRFYPNWARQAALQAYAFADALRLTLSPSTAHQICELVEDHIGELFAIPPYTPPALTSAEAVAEVTIFDRNSGQRLREVMV